MQNLDWNVVRDFLAVARTGSLSRAGRALGVNASTVGRRIEALEAGLGVRLFQRAQTGYALTDEGRDLVGRAERIEEAAIAFERRAEAGERLEGRVRLATAENLANALVIPALGGFRERHPNLTLEIVTDIRSVNLHRREADIALRLVRPVQGNVTIQRLGVQRYGLYGSLDHLARRPPRRGVRHDADRLIAWSEDYADLPAARWIEQVLEGRAPALVTSSLQGQVVAARAGLGLALLPCFLGDAEPSLRRIACDADAIEQDVWLATHSDLVGSARVQAVTGFLSELIRASAPRLGGTASLYAN